MTSHNIPISYLPLNHHYSGEIITITLFKAENSCRHPNELAKQGFHKIQQQVQ